MTLEELCEQYETQRKAAMASAGEGAPAIPGILSVILAILPVLLTLIKGGKFDLTVLQELIPTLLAALGVPAELIELAKKIITMLIGIIA